MAVTPAGPRRVSQTGSHGRDSCAECPGCKFCGVPPPRRLDVAEGGSAARCRVDQLAGGWGGLPIGPHGRGSGRPPAGSLATGRHVIPLRLWYNQTPVRSASREGGAAPGSSFACARLVQSPMITVPELVRKGGSTAVASTPHVGKGALARQQHPKPAAPYCRPRAPPRQLGRDWCGKNALVEGS